MKETERSPGKGRYYISVFMVLFVAGVLLWSMIDHIKAISGGEVVTQVISSNEKDGDVVKKSSEAGETIDVDKMVKDVLESVAFDAELSLLEDSVASGMIATADGTKLQLYMGNGTFADELVVMTAKSSNGAQQNQSNVQKHLEEMKAQFSDYLPEEAKKIDNAVQVRCGSYVIVCVTKDADNARKKIEEYIK